MPRIAVLLSLFCSLAASAAEPRARDLGVPFEGTPGPLNAITDVRGVTVGQVTLIEDLADGRKVRTGVTAILPRGRDSANVPTFAGWFAFNGAGEMTGTTWVDESGQLEGPVMLTNTHSVGVVHDATIAWRVKYGPPDPSGYWWSSAVVAETWDGDLNDINGFHVRPEHAMRALDEARGGPVAEGNVGGGTGMECHDFKCGIGTSSRVVAMNNAHYTVGVLVQANYGAREDLRIAGVPVGQQLKIDTDRQRPTDRNGSIIIVVATDAPLLPTQVRRLAKRASLGLGRMGDVGYNGSGDIFIAFSTANHDALTGSDLSQATFLRNDALNPLLQASVQATEEAIVNSMVAARDMVGNEGHFAKALPHADLVALLKQYNRYTTPSHH
jgi:D-aminopeptidase